MLTRGFTIPILKHLSKTNLKNHAFHPSAPCSELVPPGPRKSRRSHEHPVGHRACRLSCGRSPLDRVSIPSLEAPSFNLHLCLAVSLFLPLQCSSFTRRYPPAFCLLECSSFTRRHPPAFCFLQRSSFTRNPPPRSASCGALASHET